MPRRKVDLAAVAFALLVVATLAAFAYAQRVKRDPQVIDKFKIAGKKTNGFTPAGPCHKRVRLKFRTTTSNEATVEIIKPGGMLVRTLAHEFLKRYSYHAYHWDGKDDAGAIQSVGRYRMRVILEDEERSLTLPGTIRLQPQGSVRCGSEGDAKRSAGKGQSG
jgi:flagellar hook assembly protein FlgD